MLQISALTLPLSAGAEDAFALACRRIGLKPAQVADWLLAHGARFDYSKELP